MRDNPILTVIIPTYNASGSIQRTIGNIIGQTSIPNIIIVDDCSTDDTVKKVRTEFQSECKRGLIEIILLKENRGPSIARQEGIRRIKTPYFTFVDADDYYYTNNAISKISKVLSENTPPRFADIQVHHETWKDKIKEELCLSKGNYLFP